jgi:ferredoxin
MDNKVRDPQNPSGPVTIQKLKVRVDRNLCIGAATCIAVAPATFLLDSEAKAIIIKAEKDDDQQTIIDGAKSCPVAAIFVEDETGKQIFPA